MSSLAYFLAKDTVDHFNTIVKPAFYLSMFYFFNNPRSSIFDNYFVLICLVYCVTGIAYILAIYFEPGQAQLVRIMNFNSLRLQLNSSYYVLLGLLICFRLLQWSVLLPVVLTLIANQDGDKFLMNLGNFCYTKWALEAFLIANAKRFDATTFFIRNFVCSFFKNICRHIKFDLPENSFNFLNTLARLILVLNGKRCSIIINGRYLHNVLHSLEFNELIMSNNTIEVIWI